MPGQIWTGVSNMEGRRLLGKRRAALADLWSVRRYGSARVAATARIGIVLVVSIGAAVYAGLTRHGLGFALAVVGATLVASSIGFRRPTGFGVAYFGSLASLIGALAHFGGWGVGVAVIVSTLTGPFAFDALAKGNPPWRREGGH
jgi:hypothetical protein